jgi:hypothetical protein|tara:strand:+ start:812 stop:1006 length:195 start_codon:yes stop_codon:yes gene_type:complete
MSRLHRLNKEDRDILRIVVKQVHFKHYPEQFCTDYEADKMISAIAPEVIERLTKVGKDMRVDQL